MRWPDTPGGHPQVEKLGATIEPLALHASLLWVAVTVFEAPATHPFLGHRYFQRREGWEDLPKPAFLAFAGLPVFFLIPVISMAATIGWW